MQENPHPVKCFRRANAWARFSESVFICGLIKSIIEIGYLYAEAVNPFMIVVTTLNTIETPYKFLALYHVSRLMKDLRATLQYYPIVHFVPVEDTADNSWNSEKQYLYEYDGMTFAGDINANSEVV